MIHTCVPPGLYQTHTLLQEHEHCRPPTLPCAASFLHQSATQSGPLHWSKTPKPPASAETCNSTVVDPPSPRLTRWGDPLSRTDLRSCITAAAIASGRNRSAHFPPPKASKIARYSTRYICRRLSRSRLPSRTCASFASALLPGMSAAAEPARLCCEDPIWNAPSQEGRGRRADAICDLASET